MAKPGTRSRAPDGSEGHATRERIVEAALETLKTSGFAGASARAIARTGGFNQALVFYHFGSVNELLLAALEETSRRRMAAYREALRPGMGLAELMAVAASSVKVTQGRRHAATRGPRSGAETPAPTISASTVRWPASRSSR